MYGVQVLFIWCSDVVACLMLTEFVSLPDLKGVKELTQSYESLKSQLTSSDTYTQVRNDYEDCLE